MLGDCLGLGTAGSSKAGQGQLGGLFDGRLVRQAFDGLGQVHLRGQSLDFAVGHERVEQRVVDAAFKTAEEQEIFRADFRQAHIVRKRHPPMRGGAIRYARFMSLKIIPRTGT